MGIPSYFSYVIKEHRNIIKKLQNINYNNLYLDSNSIIYDAIRAIEYINKEDYENKVIESVIEKINSLISTVNAKKVLITFDGVAPFAKLNQQKTRRYKSWVTNEIFQKKSDWDRCSITPGTNFMNKLDKKIEKYYKENLKEIEIIYSGSNIPGEGEHKIFEYIRENQEYHKKTETVIYGLDSDLIMLTLNHLNISKNLFLFRETPEFIKSIDKTLDPNCYYVMDIHRMEKAIYNLISKDGSNSDINMYVKDYIFICFFIGNDFVPHHPAINIRTTGIELLIDVYRKILKPDEHLTDGKIIYWKNVRKCIDELAIIERESICDYVTWKENLKEKSMAKIGNCNDLEQKLNMVPTLDITTEQYINPNLFYWQDRYYSKLFHFKKTDERIKQVCVNFLETLEWTMKYYSIGCVDWKFCYNYNHAPLFEDLIKYIPHLNQHMIETKEKKVYHPMVQLSFVLPKQSLDLLPIKIKTMLLENFTESYKTDYHIDWGFCRYFWECHILFPDIDFDSIEKSVLKQLKI
tara:strand:+ start:4985 stop:6547 length:1563 start_codon:yes stop_codon:yes gene_type:complete